MRVLELFAGSRSIGKVAEELGCEVFSSDINNFENIDYVTDILSFDVERVPFAPDMIWASPPCTTFSVASIGIYWNENYDPKTPESHLGIEFVKKTLEIIEYFERINPNIAWYIENPVGMLRKLPIVRGLNRVRITYCSYGDTRMKPTDIWSNNIYDMFNLEGWVPMPPCFNGNTKCQHEAAPRGSNTGTQGLRNDYERSKIPPKLIKDIINATKNKL